jgi:hypothetical protein
MKKRGFVNLLKRLFFGGVFVVPGEQPEQTKQAEESMTSNTIPSNNTHVILNDRVKDQ